MANQLNPTTPIDRQTTCPFHLKLFYKTNSFHSLSDFPTSPSASLPAHLQIYTWPSCTLRELSHLLTSALPSLLPNPTIGTRLAFRLVYQDTTTTAPASAPGRYLAKELGSVVVAADADERGLAPGAEEAKYVTSGVMAGLLEGEPGKTLQEARFVIGDFIDCAVFAPGRDGAVAPPPVVRGRGAQGVVDAYRGGRGGGAFGPPRENGYGGFRGRGGGFGGSEGRLGGSGVPSGEWRRGERLPEGGGRGGGPRGGRGRAW